MKRRFLITNIILIAAMFLLIGINLYVGSAKISPARLLAVLSGSERDSVIGKIIWEIRMPRIFAAVFLGGALALSGYLLQRFFGNPIAGPFVLGISSGAKLMVAALMVLASSYGFGLHSSMMVLASLIGAGIATVFVILAARRVRNMSILIVCGVMIGYIASAITELMVSFAADSNIVNLHNWALGSFSGISWQNVGSFVPIVMVAAIATRLMAKNIEAYSYGEAYAMSLGMNVKAFRICLILVSSILSATVTAFAGPISFVGIATAHVIRILYRTDKPKILIPGIFMGGAVFCLLSDLLARALFAPMELSISTITAIFGAPVVISMLMRKKKEA